MAGDWIKMRVDLPDDPAVIAIAAATGLDEDAVVGKLHRLWCWADRHTVDGNAAGVTEMWIDRYLRADGFAKAMDCAGWLRVEVGRVVFPHFDKHNGQSGKARALTAKRVAKSKAKSNGDGNGDGNGASVTRALPREEKRREDIPPLSPGERERLLILVACRNVHDAEPAVDGALASGCLPGQIEDASRRAEGKALLTIIKALRPPSVTATARKSLASKEDLRANIIFDNDAAGVSREQTNQELAAAGLDGVHVQAKTTA